MIVPPQQKRAMAQTIALGEIISCSVFHFHEDGLIFRFHELSHPNVKPMTNNFYIVYSGSHTFG